MITRRALAAAAAAGVAVGLASGASTPTYAAPATPGAGCHLDAAGNGIQHVIMLTFDNVHFTRDNPNVPSDLEQMPHLLNFLTSNGTLDDNHHTPLIAHTGTDILTTLTGLYGDQMGQPISNSYRYYNPNGTSNPGVSFAYWTDGVFDPSTATPTDTTPTMVTPQGRVAPAPWVPFTRAGCDVGSVAAANTILENTGPDVPKVFGAGSAEAAEAAANPSLASTDFVGIGVHCAQASALCAAGNARPDLLPDEPGGYTGYQGLFGAKYVNPVISPGGPVRTVDGSAVVTDTLGRPGFPGFDGMSAANSLGYLAAMQEAGVPVTYGYISDAHDKHPTGPAYGPGEAGYVQALKSYDDSFAAFFDRLSRDGITAANTLFVVTADENDHFVGGAPSPAGCDGVGTPCTYRQIGEVNANVRGLLATQQGVTTPFSVHSDSAPNFYLDGNPARDAAVTRTFERAVSRLRTVNPITGNTDTTAQFFADPVEMRLLHMVTGDPARTPTFTAFADPDYFVFAGAPNCAAPCVALGPGFAWNHGDFAADINRTWLGLAGPGVRHLGVSDGVWSDHADVRPTVLTLLGLGDDYRHDGRALFELLDTAALPVGLRGHTHSLTAMAGAFKQLNACVGEFGAATLAASTAGVVSDSAGDARYQAMESALAALGQQRDELAGQMLTVLESAEFGGGKVDELQARALAARARELIAQAAALAG
jgi:hypothetical protein